MKDKIEKTKTAETPYAGLLKADSGGGSNGTNSWIVKMGSYGHNVLFNTTTGIYVFPDGSSATYPQAEYAAVSWYASAQSIFNNFWQALRNWNGQQQIPGYTNGSVRG